MKTQLFSIFSFVFALHSLFSSGIYAQHQECYLMMAGKRATVDGKVYLAHNNDLTGSEASMLVRVPGDHIPEAVPGFSWPEGSGYEMLVLQIYKGFAEGDAAAINAHGVAVAGGLALGEDRNRKAIEADPLVEDGLGGGVRYLALQHARTARECVQLIGDLYNQFGIKYPSGVGIADTNEIWYLEAGGGSCWAAVRIPDSCYFVAANSYRIGKIDFDDTLNFITSPNLKTYCLEKELWKEKELFHFGKIFGNGRIEKYRDNLYNTRRLWRGIDLLNPELNTPDDATVFPVFLQPADPIDLQTCFTILRDHYQGTPFDPLHVPDTVKKERPISSWNGVHTDVITLSPGEPVEYGAVMWTGLSTPYAALYVPVYFGGESIPKGYETAPSEFNEDAAFWKYKSLSDRLKRGDDKLRDQWQELRDQLEQQEIAMQPIIVRVARDKHHKQPEHLPTYLGTVSEEFAKRALDLAREVVK